MIRRIPADQIRADPSNPHNQWSNGLVIASLLVVCVVEARAAPG